MGAGPRSLLKGSTAVTIHKQKCKSDLELEVFTQLSVFLLINNLSH